MEGREREKVKGERVGKKKKEEGREGDMEEPGNEEKGGRGG